MTVIWIWIAGLRAISVNVVAAAIYNVTEASFRTLDPIWIFLLLSVVGANGVIRIAGSKTRGPFGVPSDAASVLSRSDTLLFPGGRND